MDGKADHDDGLHGKTSETFTKVYIPPLFKFRIALFIFLIWVFAATTGVGTTIFPLIIGRRMISSLFPNNAPVNDIYAFSVGIYTVGGVFYGVVHSRPGLTTMKECLQPYINSPQQVLPKAYSMIMHLLRLIYISGAFALFLPSLFALVTELYVLVPLHTYLGGPQTHVIHFVQDWTLGVLYVRMALRFILWNSGSRPAAALNAILRNGWLNPDVRLATRAFIVPAAAIASVAILGPLPLGFFLNSTIFYSASGAVHSQVYRYCYPASLAAALALWAVHLLRRQIDIWRVSIRDDVYLIGERLHNFGEKRAKEVGAARRMITS
jgi:E3 ubiquitin-protein ligase MARCH6